MTLEILSGAMTIATFATLLFLLVAAAWHSITATFNGSNHFSQIILFEPAQRFRDRFDSLSRKQSVYLASALVFLVVFLAAFALDPDKLVSGFPRWQLIAMLAIVVIAVTYGVYRFVAIVVQKKSVAFVRDANIATGHGLHRLTSNQNRTFHDVPCAMGTIDNVVVGLHGIYAVCVFARKPGKDNRVRLNGDRLSFAPGNRAVSVDKCGKRAAQLARELKKLVGHDIRIRPVIAVPGWEVDAQSSAEYLVVNERNLSMLRGWKDQNDYLMNEDVEKIQQLLTERCTRYKRH